MGDMSSYEDGDCGGSHGVSSKWVGDKVRSAKADPDRKQKFAKKMSTTADRNIAKMKNGTGKAGQNFKMASKARAGASAAKESGWDRWKGKTGTHGMSSYEDGDVGGSHGGR